MGLRTALSSSDLGVSSSPMLIRWSSPVVARRAIVSPTASWNAGLAPEDKCLKLIF